MSAIHLKLNRAVNQDGNCAGYLSPRIWPNHSSTNVWHVITLRFKHHNNSWVNSNLWEYNLPDHLELQSRLCWTSTSWDLVTYTVNLLLRATLAHLFVRSPRHFCLEAVTSLTTEAFLATMRLSSYHILARCCWSTSWIVHTLLSSSHLQKVQNYLPVKNVTGNSYFHPYHFGGLSEAAVKSMKSNEDLRKPHISSIR